MARRGAPGGEEGEPGQEEEGARREGTQAASYTPTKIIWDERKN
jgi:hypothetical protein